MKLNIIKTGFLIISLLFSFFSNQGIAQPKKHQNKIVGGSRPYGDNPGLYSAVAIGMVNSGGHCTGTIVSPNLIVTAAHCLEEERGPEDVIIYFSPSLDEATPDDAYYAESYGIHPNYSSAPENAYINDIGWIRIDFPLPAGYRPIGVLPNLSALSVGDPLTLVGYGAYGENQQGGEKRSVETVLDGYINNGRYNGLIATGPTPYRGACYGDSGGPAYVKVNGYWYVIGATSGPNGITRNATTCEDGAGLYTSIAYHKSTLEYLSGVTISTRGVPATGGNNGNGIGDGDSSIVEGALNAQLSIEDGSSAGRNFWFTINRDATVVKASLSINITHRAINELVFSIVLPDGQTVELMRNASPVSDTTNDFEFDLEGIEGMPSNGRWMVNVKDIRRGNVGTINSAKLTLHVQ